MTNYVCGAPRAPSPNSGFVLEVVEPGLLVVKYRRGQDAAKFVNIVVLKGDQIKCSTKKGTSLPELSGTVDEPARLSAHSTLK